MGHLVTNRKHPFFSVYITPVSLITTLPFSAVIEYSDFECFPAYIFYEQTFMQSILGLT